MEMKSLYKVGFFSQSYEIVYDVQVEFWVQNFYYNINILIPESKLSKGSFKPERVSLGLIDPLTDTVTEGEINIQVFLAEGSYKYIYRWHI
jgi:hypothetical protein